LETAKNVPNVVLMQCIGVTDVSVVKHAISLAPVVDTLKIFKNLIKNTGNMLILFNNPRVCCQL